MMTTTMITMMMRISFQTTILCVYIQSRLLLTCEYSSMYTNRPLNSGFGKISRTFTMLLLVINSLDSSILN